MHPRDWPRFRIAVLLLLVPVMGCGSEGPAAPHGPEPTPGAEAIDRYFEGLPAWPQPDPASDVATGPTVKKAYANTSDPIPDWQCDATPRLLVTSTNRIFAGETDFGTIWPGAVLTGASVRAGSPKLVAVERAPLTLYTDLTVGPSSVHVESPDPASVNAAIAQLVAPAGDSYKSRWSFVSEEVSTNKQGSLSLGLNGGYAATASGAVQFDDARSMSKRVFAGRAEEQMFTVRFADDMLTRPSALFGDSVSPADLAAAGIDDEDSPVYIRSITYGRLVVFTAEVTADVAERGFAGALSGMFEGVEAGGEVDGADKELLASASYHAYGLGPNAGNALSALQSGDLGLFFTPTEADKAVPLYFEIVTVDPLGAPANLGESTHYESTANCRAATAYELTTNFLRVRATSKGVGDLRIYEVETLGGLLGAILPSKIATVPVSLPPDGRWRKVDKSKTSRVGTWAIDSIALLASVVGDLEVDDWRSEYPYAALSRTGETRWVGTTTIRDSAAFFQERTIQFDIRMTLRAVFD